MIWFRRLWVEGYGRFREPVEWQFKPGLNIISGPNESGKTTILSAILDALFENPFSTAKELRERTSWNHPEGWRLQLNVQADSKSYFIHKHYPLDPKSSRTRVLLMMEDHQQTSSPNLAQTQPAGNRMEDKLALQHWEAFWDVPKSVYLATACVRQRDLDRLQQDKPVADLQASLRASATTADLNRIYKMLDERIRNLSTSRTSELKILEANILNLERELQAAKRSYSERQATRDRIRALETETAEIEIQIKQSEQTLAVWRQVQESQRKRDELRARETELHVRLEQLERLDSRLNTLAQDLESFANFNLLPDDLMEQCARLEVSLKRATEEKTKLETELESLQHEVEKALGKRKSILGTFVTGAALLTAAGVLFQTMPILAVAAGVLGIVLITAGILLRRIDPTLSVRKASVEERLKSAREEAAQAQDELTRLLRQAGFDGESLESEIARLKERWSTYREKLSEQQNLFSERQGLLAAGSPEAWREELRDTASERMAHEKELEKPAALAVLQEPPARLIHLEAELSHLEQVYQSKLNDRLRLEGQLSSSYEGDDPEELGLQIDELKARQQSLNRQAGVLDLTRTLLQQTDAKFFQSLGNLLTPEIEPVLQTITDRRYRQVQVGGDLSLTVHHPERGDWLPLEMDERAWSAGTLDQLFFACRLGLCRAMSRQRTLPLLLDDPFVHFDTVRLNRTMEFLSELGRECQIILFTCRPDDCSGKAHFIQLESVSTV